MRNVLVLASGTILGQALMVLVLPILTRLYSPSEFGLLAVYMAVLMVISPAACARLDLAIPLPQRDEDAVNLLALSIGAATIVAVFLMAIVLALPAQAAALLRQPAIRSYLWMVPLGVWLAALYSAIQFWSIRKARYRDVAQTQLIRAIGGAGGQAGLGALGWSSSGLLTGYLFYTGLGTFGLARLFWKRERALLSAVNCAALRRNLSQQRRFPLFSVPESLCDAAANNLPIVLIASIAGAREAGLMLLAQRMTSIPVGLLGGSISRVYLAEGAARHRSGELGPFTRHIMRNLLLTGIGPFVALAVGAPLLFPWIFGEDWHRAGIMVTWMTPFMMLQFVASPVSTIFAVTQKQHLAFLLQLFALILMVSSVSLAAWVTPTRAFEFFAIASTLYYACYVAMVLRCSRPQQSA